MKLYEVGGAVRDSLLGLPASDRDWVAVGARPDELLALGYKPVGRDFPVFLHPQTGEEVALARTERKSGRGYHGFVFHADPAVTLEDDLRRRDLTINAIARDDAGQLIDPFGGQRDLGQRVLRHVSAAFVEDPVRLLRVARLAARFVDFHVAPETLALLRQMVAAGEVDALVPERVWQELSRGLMEARPSRMLELLQACGAWPRLMPELADADLARTAHRLDAAAERGSPLVQRYALLAVDAARPGEPVETGGVATLAQRWRVPHDCAALAELLAREGPALRDSEALDAAGLVALLTRCDAWRRPERFELLLQALQLLHPRALVQQRLQLALAAASALDAGRVATAAAAQGLRGAAIADAVALARAVAVDEALAQCPPPSAS